MESSTDLTQHLIEVQLLGPSEAMEDEEEIPVSVESTRFDVKETNEVLQLDEAFTFEVDLLRGEALGKKVLFVEFVQDLGFPVTVSFNVG